MKVFMEVFIVISCILFPFLSYATRYDFKHPDYTKSESFGLWASCNNQQTELLQNYSQKLNLRLDENQKNWPIYNLLGVKKNFVIPEKRVWNETNPNHALYNTYWANMNRNTALMLEESIKGINYQCSSQIDSKCKDGVIAYVLFFLGKPRKVIHLCPIFWSDDESSRVEHLYHELSHYAASTFDYAGDWWNGKENIDAVRGSMDAYHVQEFYAGEPTNILRRMIWTWWWPKEK